MKAAQIELTPLRDLAAKLLDEFMAKYPEHAQLAEQLKKSTASILGAEKTDFETFHDLLSQIDQAADKLDDMYIYAAAQDVIPKLDSFARKSLSKDVPVFPEVMVSLQLPSPDAASSVPTEPGHRTKLGGEPQWVQTDETPICKSCQKAMTFIEQIDSIAAQKNDLGKALSDKKSFMFADVGMIYVFLCLKCYDAKAVVQTH
jgi:hypothetical protein